MSTTALLQIAGQSITLLTSINCGRAPNSWRNVTRCCGGQVDPPLIGALCGPVDHDLLNLARAVAREDAADAISARAESVPSSRGAGPECSGDGMPSLTRGPRAPMLSPASRRAPTTPSQRALLDPAGFLARWRTGCRSAHKRGSTAARFHSWEAFDRSWPFDSPLPRPRTWRAPPMIASVSVGRSSASPLAAVE